MLGADASQTAACVRTPAAALACAGDPVSDQVLPGKLAVLRRSSWASSPTRTVLRCAGVQPCALFIDKARDELGALRVTGQHVGEVPLSVLGGARL